MMLATDPQTTIIRTEAGLTIAGTRITLYDIMDHLSSGWTPKLILNWLPLSESQMEAALAYIEAHRSEVEAEYQEVLRSAQEVRAYWEDRNRDRLAEIAKMPPRPEQAELHAKLQAWKVQLGMTTC
jgi:uncharacterized protein (DUF433 family)